MSELHVSVIRKILDKPIMADVEIDTDDMDKLTDEEQADALFRCYQSASDALDIKEVERQLQSIKDIPIE